MDDEGFTTVVKPKSFKVAQPRPPRQRSPPPDTQFRLLPNMELGRGAPLTNEIRSKLADAPSCGTGTTNDPYIWWIGQTSNINPQLLKDCERVARGEAEKQKLPFVVIRGKPHSETRTRASDRSIVTEENRNGTEDALRDPLDIHLTLYLGQAVTNVQLHGHIFLNIVDRNNVPYPDTTISYNALRVAYDNQELRIADKMAPSDRKVIQNGHHRVGVELYEWGSSLARKQINRDIREMYKNTHGHY